jgi:hypothetical protein
MPGFSCNHYQGSSRCIEPVGATSRSRYVHCALGEVPADAYILSNDSFAV